jgi:hypothetical protein
VRHRSTTQQFELLIEDEIQNMESLTLHDKSMLTSYPPLQPDKAPKGFFVLYGPSKEKEIKNKFNIAKADTRDTFIA